MVEIRCLGPTFSVATDATGYTVTAVNPGGSATVVVTITVNAAAAGPGDVAVNVSNTTLYKLKASDGTEGYLTIRPLLPDEPVLPEGATA